MAREIKISIKSGFDPSGISDASHALDKMAHDLEKTNKWLMECNAELSSAIHRHAQGVAVDYAAAADKAAKAMGSGYRSLGGFLNDVKRESREAAEKVQALREKIQAAAKAAHEAKAEKKMRGFGDGADSSVGKVGKLSDAINQLTQGTGLLGKVLSSVFAGSLWTAGAAAIRAAFNLIKSQYDKIKEELENYRKQNLQTIESVTKSLEEYKIEIEEVANAERDAAEKGLNAKQREIDLTNRLTKATTELARQKRIAAGEDEKTVNDEADAQNASSAAKSARDKSDAKINASYRRIDIATDERDRALDELEKLRQAKDNLAEDWEFDDPEQQKAQRKLRRTMTDKIEQARRIAEKADLRIVDEEKNLENEKKNRAALDMELEAADIKRKKELDDRDAVENFANYDNYSKSGSSLPFDDWKKEQKKKKDEEEKKTKEAYADFLKSSGIDRNADAKNISSNDSIFKEFKKRQSMSKELAEKEAAAREAAAKKAAETQKKLDAEAAAARERQAQKELDQKIKNHQKLLAAENKAEGDARTAQSKAESKLQQAWGWYRDKDSMRAQLEEEKADAAAQKQFEKDFAKLKSKRRDWRTAENLSVDDEAVRRVGLAREEKAAADKHLAEIEKNTADLAKKLDELLQVKG